MNGNGYDDTEVYGAFDDIYSSGVKDYGAYNDAQGGSIFSDFLGQAREKLSQVISRPDARPGNTTDSIGGAMFEAIYQYGKGKAELALQSAITKSKTGQAAIKNIEMERLWSYMPYLIGAGVLLFIIGMFIRRA